MHANMQNTIETYQTAIKPSTVTLYYILKQLKHTETSRHTLPHTHMIYTPGVGGVLCTCSLSPVLSTVRIN